MLNQTGIPTSEQVLSRFPDRKALVRPKAILECYEDIPCNPCSTACPFNAINIGDNINTQPKLNVEACTGCGLCIPSCPGVAIVVVQLQSDKAVFKLAYEFLPIPEKKQVWYGVNRSGDVICDAHIDQVLLSQQQDHTAVITVSVPAEHLYEFVTIRVKNE
ncbi:MAG: 4Fe-4S binding protein [Acholeplasmataceae bacterium]|nr:4Fe-4S binding protein [Acholeplasmataceae bacterium]